MYDVCVVGAGTMGSSAAYHLSKNEGLKVALIGPDEPEHKTPDNEVFGCHYDEGRITRVISPIESEQILAYRSMLGYEQLERESGLKIYTEVGFAVFGAKGDPEIEDYSSTAERFCEKHNLAFERMDHGMIKEKWGYLGIPSNFNGGYSKKYNGHISVRNLVKACQSVYAKNGGTRYSSRVQRIVPSDEQGFEIELDTGDVVRSDKVVVTCGAFSNFFNLLPREQQEVDCQLVGHTVMKFELTDEDRVKLRNLPSLMYKPRPNTTDYIYILPPIKYPNGKTYLKFGHTTEPSFDNEDLARNLETLDDVKNWHCRTEYPEARRYFNSMLSKLFPTVQPVSGELDFCVMTFTPSGKQYIDFIQDGMFVAFGGNGKSAKMGLEIGNICARSVLKGSWEYDLDKEQFSVQFRDQK